MQKITMKTCPHCGSSMKMERKDTFTVKSECPECGLKMTKDFKKRKILELYQVMLEME